MTFDRISPYGPDRKAVECYWLVTDNSNTPNKQKIIPDGYPEIIFHFGDHYKVNLGERWSKQSKSLFAGQIRGHFYLENTGVVDILGIKLKPSAATHLFNVSMKQFRDTVVPLRSAVGNSMNSFETSLRKENDPRKRADFAIEHFSERCLKISDVHPIDRAVDIVISKKGMITVAEVCSELSVSERYLEQIFQKYVGLSPKFYARIIRFSYIFQLVNDKAPDWADIVYEAGYYDQSHFIRNFKAFTGEDPTAYFFAEKNLANFFLKK